MHYKGIEWKVYKGILLPVTAQHYSIKLTKKEQRELLKKSGVHLIRWTNAWDISEQKNFWYVIKDSFEGMSELKSNMRNQVRKGLKLCNVERISGEYLLENGYEVYKNAHIRYNKKNNLSKNIPSEYIFRDTYKESLLKSEFWGVFEKETKVLIGFAENSIWDKSAIYGSMKFDPAYLKCYGSYALIYTMNKYYLEECSLLYVSDGPRSLLHETNIQELLIKFNFRKAYCQLNLALSPLLHLAVLAMYPLRKNFYSSNFDKIKKLAVILKMVEIVKKDEGEIHFL